MTRQLKIANDLVITETEVPTHQCDANPRQAMLGMTDAMAVIGGKWKLRLIGTLILKGKFRFKDLQRQVEGIGAKMLSRELQELEANKVVKRTVMQTRPITVEYEITPYGRSLETIVHNIVMWGVEHREKIMKPDSEQ